MSVVNNFKFGSHLRPVVGTCLTMLKECTDQQQPILKILGPALPKNIVAQIRGVFSRSLEQEPTKSFEQAPPKKRLKTSPDTTPEATADKNYQNGAWMIAREVEVVAACNPRLHENFKLRRAETRAFERVFFDHPGAPLFWESIKGRCEEVYSFLDIKDLLCGMSSLSLEMNYRVSQLRPRIWQGLSNSFALPKEIYWTEYSKKQVKANFLHLRNMEQAFRRYCQSPQVKVEFLKFAGMMEFPPILRENSAADPRFVFKEGILPVISSMINRGKSLNPPSDFLARLINPAYFGCNPFFMYEAFLASGEPGDWSILGQLCDYLQENLFKAKAEENEHEAGTFEAAAQRALCLAGKYAEISTIDHLLVTSSKRMVASHLQPVFLELIERGIKCTPLTMVYLLQAQAKELLEVLIKKGSVKVYRSNIKHYMYVLASARAIDGTTTFDAPNLLAIIELLLKHATDATSDPEMAAKAIAAQEPRIVHNVFLEMARCCDDQLMKKLISLGYGPNNTNSPENTLYRAFVHTPPSNTPYSGGISGNVFDDIHWQYWKRGMSSNVIATLLKHGATMDPSTARFFIQMQYPTEPETQAKLFNLLGPK